MNYYNFWEKGAWRGFARLGIINDFIFCLKPTIIDSTEAIIFLMSFDVIYGPLKIKWVTFSETQLEMMFQQESLKFYIQAIKPCYSRKVEERSFCFLFTVACWRLKKWTPRDSNTKAHSITVHRLLN